MQHRFEMIHHIAPARGQGAATGAWLHMIEVDSGRAVGGVATHYRVEIEGSGPYEVLLHALIGGELVVGLCGIYDHPAEAVARAQAVQREVARAAGGLAILPREMLEREEAA